MAHFLEQAKVLTARQARKYYLRSFQIHSSVSVRGVYTSDILYNAMTLPPAMKFKKPKTNDWFADYAWASYPKMENPPSAPAATDT